MNLPRLFFALVVGCTSSCGTPQPSARLTVVSAGRAVTVVNHQACGQLNVDYCPGLSDAYCALERIKARHDACDTTEDCVFARLDAQCVQFLSMCPPPAVNTRERAAYQAQDAAERTAYCSGAGAGCLDEGVCAYDDRRFTPHCVDHRCVAVLTP